MPFLFFSFFFFLLEKDHTGTLVYSTDHSRDEQLVDY